MKKQQPTFVLLTRRNFDEIARKLRVGRGIFLFADPEYYSSPADRLSGTFRVNLIDGVRITGNSREITVTVSQPKKVRGRKSVRNREYRLRPMPVPKDSRPNEMHNALARMYGQPENLDKLYERARNLFQRLVIDEYEFEIHRLAFSSAGYNPKRFWQQRGYYIPRGVSLEAALTDAFKWMLGTWNKQRRFRGWPKPYKFTEVSIQTMVNYMLEDLKTNKVLTHNIQAGLDADSLTGLD